MRESSSWERSVSMSLERESARGRQLFDQREYNCVPRGQHAGSWLAVFPTTFYTVARGRHYRLALRARVGLWLPGLASADDSAVRWLQDARVDACGMHYGSCKNRGNMWTCGRSDMTLWRRPSYPCSATFACALARLAPLETCSMMTGRRALGRAAASCQLLPSG